MSLLSHSIGDEQRPECRGCRQREEVCDWGMKITFKQDNANSLGIEHPSMQQSSRKRPRHFEVRASESEACRVKRLTVSERF